MHCAGGSMSRLRYQLVPAGPPANQHNAANHLLAKPYKAITCRNMVQSLKSNILGVYCLSQPNRIAALKAHSSRCSMNCHGSRITERRRSRISSTARSSGRDSSGATTGLLPPPNSDLSDHHDNNRSNGTSSSPASAHNTALPTPSTESSSVSSSYGASISTSSLDSIDHNTSNELQPAVQYIVASSATDFSSIRTTVPPSAPSSTSSYDNDGAAVQPRTDQPPSPFSNISSDPLQGVAVQLETDNQQVHQLQQQQPEQARSGADSSSTASSSTGAALWVEAEIMQRQQQQLLQEEVLSAGDVTSTTGNDSSGSDSSYNSSSSSDLLMSFMEEDLNDITSMYDVISRASTVVHQQKQRQQWKRQQEYTLQQAPEGMPQQSPAVPSSSSSSSSIVSSSLSSQDLIAIAELQVATEKKLAELQHAVEELQLGEEATQQLTDVLHKLEQLEQDLSAVVQHSSSSSSSSNSVDVIASPVDSKPSATAAAAVVPAPSAAGVAATPPAAAAAAVAAAAAAAGSLSIAHTLEMEALAASATMGGATTPPASLLDAATVAPPAAAAAAAAAAAVTSSAVAATPAAAPSTADSTRLWPLFVLGLSYVHQATTGFALPALLPMISPDLDLTDFQGALLTSGYSYLYALALVPVGLLADKLDRPKLLAVGLMLWSSLSIVSSGARSFGEMVFARTGFAIAQAAQNPVSFSLIPDLFPANKSTALAGYNCAIYLGRALSFAAVLAAHRVSAASKIPGGKLPAVGTMADAAAGNVGEDGVALSMVPLDALDLQRMSIIYTTGDMAAVTPLYNYNFHVIAYEAVAGGNEGWRQLMTWIGYPGFVIALIMWLSVREPRHDSEQQQQQQQGATQAAAAAQDQGGLQQKASFWKEGASKVTTQLFNAATGHGWHTGSSSSSSTKEANLAGPACIVDSHLQPSTAAVAVGSSGSATAAIPVEAEVMEASVQTPGSAQFVSGENPIMSLLKIKPFQATTIAAALNDVGSYSLIAWHSTFYERVFGLDSGVYAPMLAVILPVGGILGGVGGGLIADWLSVVGGRYWLTAGASLLAAPFVAQSLLAETPAGSFTALLAGFALSEAWRAPGAIMIRSVAPQELGSTASALYLCIRNLIGGFGPVAVAKLAELVGLQHAMLLAPACYVVSGLIFYIAEKEIEDLQRQQQQQEQQ